MRAVALIDSKYWNNVYSTFRTAEGLGFDTVYVVDLRMGKPPKMNRRKIDFERPPWNLFKLVTMEEFLNIIMPQFSCTAMELTEEAEDLGDYEWFDDNLLIMGPEDGNVPQEIIDKCKGVVKVEMEGHIKCFNLACAASIAMYHMVLFNS